MRVPFFQIDAFASRPFAGNPAAVLVLDAFLDDSAMQAIAAENNLAETAFIVSDRTDYQIRWFTPRLEVPLCGHATLASAAVVMERLQPERNDVTFHSKSGPLTVKRMGGKYVMNFPSRPSEPIAIPPALASAIGVEPVEVLSNEFNYMAVLTSAQIVRHLAPAFDEIARLDRPGVIVTAPGDEDYDFVSRYFAPAKGIPEDPVTGGAHCMLAPYWATRLGKTSFHAYQASPRGGEIDCRLVGDRIELEGACIFFLEGEAQL